MNAVPEIVERPEQPYVAVRSVVSMRTLGSTLPPLLPEVFGWLGQHGHQPAGPPFWKYDVIDMAANLVVEVGVPVVAPVSADGRMMAGVLPAGRYATVVHVGHPEGLQAATGALLEWADRQGLKWDMREAADGEHWGCRLEEYLTDPAEVPDMAHWETRLAYRLA
jgi:effector-binding domain-containing protein